MNTTQFPKPGDVLFRPKAAFTHTGIYMPSGFVFDNAPGRGEGLVSWETFSQGQKVTFKSVSAQEAVQNVCRSYSMLAHPRPYALMSNNCQDTVTRAIGMEPHSWERNTLLLFAGIASLFLLASAK